VWLTVGSSNFVIKMSGYGQFTRFIRERINCGSTEANNVTALGASWGPDKWFYSGKSDPYTSGQSPMALFNRARIGQDTLGNTVTIKYKLSVPSNGKYEVKMYFKENYFTKAAQRLFDVKVDGQFDRQLFDIYNEMKTDNYGTYASVTSHIVSISGASDANPYFMELLFVPQKNLALVSAIELYYLE